MERGVMTTTNVTKQCDIGRRLREIPPEKHVASYEWEELVQKLCASADDGLHIIGIKELNELKHE